jgi:hypothetical protein
LKQRLPQHAGDVTLEVRGEVDLARPARMGFLFTKGFAFDRALGHFIADENHRVEYFEVA